ncbi:glycosyltransferase family 32 protein [Clostridium beijerinckii]|uniref:Mannosyltransferase n=1 Tax=Clostridium beijerinckii TaxID=1520 RepID=A0A7X9XP61_CLOBE|nr:glycosyltransferase [Clostridium beijerinckii]NMF04835.1 mannosyltransferase [Clostridium beijerinckii]
MHEKIPKIIHYCWFGENNKPKEVKECMQTWSILHDYKIVEWNEQNSNLQSNKYVQKSYNQKKWAFVSDYIRLKALYEHGGIYLDTDVEVQKTFNDLLDNNMFIGFIFDCSIGTAVIGAKPKHPIIKELLELYNEIICFDDYFILNKWPNIKLVNNNDLFTLYFLNKYSEFKLNNKKQYFTDLTIYPKESFEIQPIIGKNYSIHRCGGSWIKKLGNNKQCNYKEKAKAIFDKIPIIHINSIFTHINHIKRRSTLPFYKQYLEHKQIK